MANIWEKAISILAVNLNKDRSYLITTVPPNFLPESSVRALNINHGLVKLVYIKFWNLYNFWIKFEITTFKKD